MSNIIHGRNGRKDLQQCPNNAISTFLNIGRCLQGFKSRISCTESKACSPVKFNNSDTKLRNITNRLGNSKNECKKNV